MERGEVQAGLMSVVDYQMCERELVLVPAGMIGCDGATLTVRLFSKVPAREIRVVHGDTDSHTSVMLAEVILRERYGVGAKVVPLERSGDRSQRSGPETMLLIGDKVVNGARNVEGVSLSDGFGGGVERIDGVAICFCDVDDEAG